MANQFRFFIGKNKEEIDQIKIKTGQMFKTADGIFYEDISDSERIKLEFTGGGDWNQNDPNGMGYIKNRTHWYSDASNKTVGKRLPVEFLPEGAKVYPLYFTNLTDAYNASVDANINPNSEYSIGQLVFVFDASQPNPTSWYYINNNTGLTLLGNNPGSNDLSQYIKKDDIVTNWYDSRLTDKDNDRPISYGAVKEVVGDIEHVLRNY